MLNFRKLKQDFSQSIVKDGKDLYEDEKVLSAKILHMDHKCIRIGAKVQGQFDNAYESEIEIDRLECETIDSNCDCPYNYDCQHIAALLFYLENNFEGIMVDYSTKTDFDQLSEDHDIDEEAKEELLESFKEAQEKQEQKQEEAYQRQVLEEYVTSSKLLATSPFFRSFEAPKIDKAEIMFIVHTRAKNSFVDFQISLRLPFRSKPLSIPNVKEFFEAITYKEEIAAGGKRYHFTLESFAIAHQKIVQCLLDHAQFGAQSEKAAKFGQLEREVFGALLADAYATAKKENPFAFIGEEEEVVEPFSGIYLESIENPLCFSKTPAFFRFFLEYMEPPTSTLLVQPMIVVKDDLVDLDEVELFECNESGMIYNAVYYRFTDTIQRSHLRFLRPIREMTIPKPLFGTFIENALPELAKVAEVASSEVLERIGTLPYVDEVTAVCDLTFLNSELEAQLFFNYNAMRIPADPKALTYEDAASFVLNEGVVARNLVEEQKIVEDLFQDFAYEEQIHGFIAKSEKKIIEFMTDIIPRNQGRVTFNCPQNLLDQFIYDETEFKLNLKTGKRIDAYEIVMQVNGPLEGTSVDLLWECMTQRRSFIELETPGRKKGAMPKILVLDLEKLSGVITLFDELGITKVANTTFERPLWSLASLDEEQFKKLPIEVVISKQLLEMRAQMLGDKAFTFSPMPKAIQASLRPYQEEGVHWLERLRVMYLNGILADDMGLGKTLQAIVAIAQGHREGKLSLIVCPTSLLYNWKEEFHKFHPKLRALVVDGIPSSRRKLIEGRSDYDVLITSYTLLQKDIDLYDKQVFSYAILDEAQHIKNRGTRNAKSVKKVKAEYRLILSGTPIENALEEMWSLFDFLMPGFLSSYERFIEKYVRVSGEQLQANMHHLRKKVSPFIMRRMKSDVLKDLPPISELVYHCQLSDVQQELYKSFAASARDELVKLVKKEGFDRVQIHVLATLTRLKQICCHPAIFAKEKVEPGDSAKYDMLMELLQTLIEGKHKTVIFSQYTRMLQIMRNDFTGRGIRFSYLDGASKNRLQIVNEFNEDKTIPVFLVSLKAGGTGLNLTGADTVIHYDMWWNPAVEAQATDRVHRIGQQNSVSSYKLITLGTIEEKIAEMQAKKKGLVKKVISCDDEAIAKLTWEDVLELLKT